MQRERGELVPIGEVIDDLDGPVTALRDDSSPARRGFTVADQVDRLVAASEADPDRGFMARTMALCSLPRSNPGNQHQYKRKNGPFELVMIAGADNKLPFGNFPRLLMAWVSTEAVRTQSRLLVLGSSLSDFMRTLGIYHNSGGRGGVQTRLRNQMDRLFNAHISLIYKDERGKATVNTVIARRSEFWWNPKRPDESTLWESKIELSEDFFQEIIRHPVPLDTPTFKNDFVNAANYSTNASMGVHLTLAMTFPDLSQPESILPGMQLLEKEYPGPSSGWARSIW